MVHFFGKDGTNELKYEDFKCFMENLQQEVLELEFHEFSKGRDTISEIDFAKILLRYTHLDTDEYVFLFPILFSHVLLQINRRSFVKVSFLKFDLVTRAKEKLKVIVNFGNSYKFHLVELIKYSIKCLVWISSICTDGWFVFLNYFFNFVTFQMAKFMYIFHCYRYDKYLDRIIINSHLQIGITFEEFCRFYQFLNSLDDFSIAMRMYTLADHPISKGFKIYSLWKKFRYILSLNVYYRVSLFRWIPTCCENLYRQCT